MTRLLYDGTSRYNRYRIVEKTYRDRPSRLLLAGQTGTPQSGVAFDDDPELLFEYNQRLFEVAISLQPQSVLVIGGGAFTLPQALIDRLAIPRVDVVEIDPLLPKLARKFFKLKRNRRLRLYTSDGRDYIDSCQTSYDLIIVDAFSEYETPRSLLTVEAAQQYARLLQPHGTIAFNIISRYTGDEPALAQQMIASFSKSFTTTQLFPADPDDTDQDHDQNLIFIASHEQTPSLDYLQSTQVFPPRVNNIPLYLHD